MSTFLSQPKLLAFSFLLQSLAFSGAAWAEVTIPWPAEKSCVAWQTKKTMFLFNSVVPIGINCEIAVKDTVGVAGHQITLTAPIERFDSGEASRDKEVLILLKGDVQPVLEFQSKPLEEAKWTTLLNGELKQLDGELKLGGKSYPVTAELTVSGDKDAKTFEGVIASTFTAFDIKPPKVAGGIVASVEDALNLRFKILSKDIQH